MVAGRIFFRQRIFSCLFWYGLCEARVSCTECVALLYSRVISRRAFYDRESSEGRDRISRALTRLLSSKQRRATIQWRFSWKPHRISFKAFKMTIDTFSPENSADSNVLRKDIASRTITRQNINWCNWWFKSDFSRVKHRFPSSTNDNRGSWTIDFRRRKWRAYFDNLTSVLVCLALIAFPGVQSYESRFRIPAYVATYLKHKRMHQERRMQRRIENVHEHNHHPNRWHGSWQGAKKNSIQHIRLR